MLAPRRESLDRYPHSKMLGAEMSSRLSPKVALVFRPSIRRALLTATALSLWCCFASPARSQSFPEEEVIESKPVDIGQLVEEYLAKREAGLVPKGEAESFESTDVEGCEGEDESCDAAPAGGLGDLIFKPRWKHGLEWATEDDDFVVHIGGRYQFDVAGYTVDEAVQQNIRVPYGNGVDFRRARIRLEGRIYKLIDYCTEIDFVNSYRALNQPSTITVPGFVENTTVALTDFWWQVKDVPLLGDVRVGQQKEPIGFEHIVSSRFLPFMERSYNQDTFYGGNFNGFSPGISAARHYGDNDSGLIHYGLFKPVNNVFGQSTGTGDYSVVGRITKLLAYQDDGRFLVHVGVSGKQASAVGQAGVPGRVQVYRTRDAIRNGLSQFWPVPAGIALYGDDLQQVNGEVAMVAGPWTLQSEYTVNGHQDARTDLSLPTGGTVVYHGGYIQLLRYLTDDYDQYDKDRGSFGRVIPSTNLTRREWGRWNGFGGGAWQVGARYNYLDLNDAGFNGGILHNQTYGLNWFFNPNMKMQFNYIATYRDVSQTINFPNGSGWIHGFGTRIAMDF